LTSWVPFVENMYGLSQGGCWIKTSESDFRRFDMEVCT